MKYIECEAAYPLAKKICDAIDSEDFQRFNFGMRILDWIDEIPAADVVAVVRCKECWFYQKDMMICSLHEADFAPDAFCSYATTDGKAEFWGLDKKDHDKNKEAT